ncbi:MAG: hypothetical protein HUJ26_03825 [Planctomycetaceae bacterium]|nr:hypothetical protein [Planctomycetaceae bacterium]
MNDSSKPEVSNVPTHSAKRHILSALGVSVILILFAMGGLVTWQILKFHQHRQATRRMEIAITRLAFHRPENLTDDQWAYCILLTWNLQTGYAHPSYIPTEEIERICAELEVRIDAGPDLATIDWFWDEYYRVYPPTQSNEWMRPTTADNREQFEAGAHGGHPLSYWQTKFKRLSKSVN